VKLGEPSWRTAWNMRLADAVASLGGISLPDHLITGLQEVATVRNTIIFGYPVGQRPVLLHNAMSNARKVGAIATYLRGSYLLDPFFEACRRGIASGVYRMEELAPDDFISGVGAHPGYVSPCISDEPGALSEEIGFITACASGYYIVLSLMRDGNEPPFSETELMMLREIEPPVSALLAAQFDQRRTEGDMPNPIDEGFDQLFVETLVQLTPREREIAELILRGHSSGSIAEILGIAISTVKIHRRNIYAKLEISTQAEFFAIFMARMTAT